jgi:hypothetical protein
MTIDARCSVCKNADRRRLIELGWNGGMGAETIGRVLGDMSGATILKHLKEHAEGDGNARLIDVEPELPVRDRVLNLQRMQLDEVERRIALAKQRAAVANDLHKNEPDWIDVDWSHYFDILGKDGQAAIGSILKAQGLSDKREKAVADTKLGLFEAMAKNGLAPKVISGALVSGEEPEDD